MVPSLPAVRIPLIIFFTLLLSSFFYDVLLKSVLLFYTEAGLDGLVQVFQVDRSTSLISAKTSDNIHEEIL